MHTLNYTDVDQEFHSASKNITESLKVTQSDANIDNSLMIEKQHQNGR